MTKYCGYMGRVALLDLSARKAGDYFWTDLDREKYIGGKAMASRILYDNLTGKEKAFDPENLIVIATGPLTGTGAPSSNRFDISSLSPLTGITASSNCGGNFGHYLKKAGFDALIVRGKCESPTWVEIENGEFRFHDAAALWGMKTTETQEALQAALNASHGKSLRCGMVTGCGFVELGFGIGVLDGVICKIGFSLVFLNFLGVGETSFWWGTAVSRFLPGVLCLWYFLSGKWKTRKMLSD